MDYSESHKDRVNLAVLGMETLKVLEQTGGEYALDKIRQVFPTYESQV
jgi:hypothetical protein